MEVAGEGWANDVCRHNIWHSRFASFFEMKRRWLFGDATRAFLVCHNGSMQHAHEPIGGLQMLIVHHLIDCEYSGYFHTPQIVGFTNAGTLATPVTFSWNCDRMSFLAPTWAVMRLWSTPLDLYDYTLNDDTEDSDEWMFDPHRLHQTIHANQATTVA